MGRGSGGAVGVEVRCAGHAPRREASALRKASRGASASRSTYLAVSICVYAVACGSVMQSSRMRMLQSTLPWPS